MSNDLQITISPEEFDKIEDSENQSAIDKKLGLIFKTVSIQQTHCKETVARLEQSIQKVSAPKMNKDKVGGAVGGATGLGVLIDRVIHYFMQ